MVLDRAATAIRGTANRAQGRAGRPSDDPIEITVLLDASVAAPTRLQAGRRLGLTENIQVRAIALAGGQARIESASGAHWPSASAANGTGPQRAGIGPMVGLLDLPASWAAARTAFRLTAADTEHDPGPRIVHADQLGGLAVLASAIGPDTEPSPDVGSIERARTEAPWTLATLVAIANSASLRTAATALRVHHSTLQERLGHVEHALGWTIRDPHGRLRLQLALAMWRLHRQVAANTR
jgi:sugar diacid utilization regulator